MEGGPPIFNPGFPSPSLIHGLTRLPLQDFHLLRCVIQTLRRSSGLSAFDRLYSRNRCCFLFLCLLRCFTSARSLLIPIHSESGTPKGGLPHSDTPGSRPSYRLPWTFRRFLRPSSPLDTKSSAMYPCAWSYQPDAATFTPACASGSCHAYSQFTPMMHKNIIETSNTSSLSLGHVKSPACLS